MGNTKKRRDIEVYENYWKFTAAFTDIYGTKFNHCLNVIVNYIDEHRDALIANANSSEDFSSSYLYKNLQQKIVEMMDYKRSDGTLSARKAINLFVKIGFIKPFLVGYHPLVKRFINASDEQKRILYSKIFYESSSLASGTTEDNTNLHHVSFFLQTLDYNKSLSNKDLTALMVTDILASGETSDIPNHVAMKHSAQMLNKMSYVKDGGDRKDIPEDLRPKSGDVRKYIRYASDKPSVCVTGDMRKIFHYSQNRALTCRELARIQTFPDSFIFEGSSIQIQQQIGNAVPPRLAYLIAKQVEEALDNA